MIANILIFIRNCVMAVLTAWAGIHIAEQANPKAEPAAAPASPRMIHASDDKKPCPKGVLPAESEPSSSAAAGQEHTRPDSEQRVLTIR